MRHGKGDKARTTYMGGRAMREMVRYMRFRKDIGSNEPVEKTPTFRSGFLLFR